MLANNIETKQFENILKEGIFETANETANEKEITVEVAFIVDFDLHVKAASELRLSRPLFVRYEFVCKR